MYMTPVYQPSLKNMDKRKVKSFGLKFFTICSNLTLNIKQYIKITLSLISPRVG